MKIVKDSTNRVIFIGDVEWVDGKLSGLGYAAPFCTPETHTIEEVETIPSDYMGGHYAYDGSWVKTEAGISYDTERLAVMRSEKLQALTNYAKSFLSAAMSDYSEWEAISWPMMITESEKFQTDGTIGEYMAAEIGVKYPDAESLATVILQRKEAMKALRAGVILVRQAKEAAIEAAETIDDLNIIKIEEGWA